MGSPGVVTGTAAIPEELKGRPQWVGWRLEERKDGPTKVPYSPRGGLARTTDPNTWASFGEALFFAEKQGMDGVGFVFGPEDPYCGVDLDKCRDPETGELEVWAREIIAELSSYAELSPSGTGVHIYLKAGLPEGGNRHGRLEMYDRGRFFTITGEHLEGAPAEIHDRQAELEWLHRCVFGEPKVASAGNGHHYGPPLTGLSDQGIIARAMRAKNGDKFVRLWEGDASGYESASEADLALCSLLAYWIGPDVSRMDALFRQSGLYREKWEREDYRERTISKALERAEFWKGGGMLAPLEPGESETNGHGQSYPSPNGAGGIGDTLFTDVGNAQRFIDEHGSDLRYCFPWGKWLVYDGARWIRDQTGEVQRRAKATAVRIFEEAAEAARAGNTELGQKLAKHAIRSQSAARIRDMIELAKPDVPVTPEELDRDPWLLNVENGTIDLKTGELREHNRENLITKLVPVRYDPAAKAPVFEAFLKQIIPSPEIRAYLKKLVGYSVTGDVSEQILPVLHGTGANGKSTLLNVLLEMIGDYGMQAPPDLLIAKRDAHPTELADLFGARFVASIEVEDGRRFAESLVKQLTGGDRIKARRMREDFWQFGPTHKVFMAANHKPGVRGTDNAIWRRIRLIPFSVTISPGEQDKKLPEKLRAELPGILAWAVSGCLEWQREGLIAPEEVKAATDEYREEMDTLAAFIADRCVVAETASAGATELYNAYKKWCEESGESPLSGKRFWQQLIERGFEKHKQGSVRYYGIGLRYEGGGDPGGNGPSAGSARSLSVSLKPGEKSAGTAGASKSSSAGPESLPTDREPDYERLVEERAAGLEAAFEPAPERDAPAGQSERGEPEERPDQEHTHEQEHPEPVPDAPGAGFECVEKLLCDPPDWLRRELNMLRDGRLRLPLVATHVATTALGSHERWAETLPFVLDVLDEEGGP